MIKRFIIQAAIMHKLNSCVFLSFALEGSTYIDDVCQLAICIRCVEAEYNKWCNYDNCLSLANSVKFAGVCTDRAKVMCGKNDGFSG